MKHRLPTKPWPLLGLLGLVACATTKPAAQTAPPDTAAVAAGPAAIGSGPATEDLARYRPVFAPPAGPAAATPATAPRPPVLPKAAAPAPTNQVNAPVEQRLRDQAYQNEKVRYTSGYRVRVYLGLERDQVMSIRRQIISRYPDETDYITFKQPVYRLYIGDYPSRLEAARALGRLRQLAPKAELEPMQVLVNKTP